MKQVKEKREKRILTGQTYKPVFEDYKKAYYERKAYENKHLGGFEKIYPTEGIVKTQNFIF